MADAREVPWAEIREAFETTDVGLQALAERYGFASKTTIKRRRDAEGWSKVPDVVRANLATRAARGTELGDGIVPPVPTPGTPAGHTETQQNRASAPPPSVDVPPDGRGGSSLTPIPATELSRVPMATRVEWLAEMRAKSERTSLEAAEQMQRVGRLLMTAAEVVLMGPEDGATFDPEHPSAEFGSFGRALLVLRAVNADKDTLKDAIKQGAAMTEAGVKLEREILGLDLPQVAGSSSADASGLPSSPMLTPTQILEAVGGDLAQLRVLADMGRKVQTLRPAIEGEAERIPP